MPKRRRDDVPSLANLAKRVVYDWGAVDTIWQLVGMSQLMLTEALTEVVRWAGGFYLPARRLTNPTPRFMRTAPNPRAPARWEQALSWRHRFGFRSESTELGRWSGTERMKWRAARPTRLADKRAWNSIRAGDQAYLTEPLADEVARLAADPLGKKIWGPYVNPLAISNTIFVGDRQRSGWAVVYDALMASVNALGNRRWDPITDLEVDYLRQMRAQQSAPSQWGWPTNWPTL